MRRPGRRAISTQSTGPAAIQARQAWSSLRMRGSTVRNRPFDEAMWSMLSRVASLQSATYKKLARPAMSRQVFQVAMWVVESSVLPLTIWAVIGTAPSADTVRIHTSCLRSGLWSLEWPRAGRGGVTPARGAPVALS